MAALHLDALNCLCCVCGFMVKRKDDTHRTEGRIELIGETFGEIFNPDTIPHYICHACWRTVHDYQHRNTKVGRKVVMKWEEHDNKLCKTCDLYLERRKGGARKKGKSKGRPKSIGVWKESDIPQTSNVSFEFDVTDLVPTDVISSYT